jgi:hypothetical protein
MPSEPLSNKSDGTGGSGGSSGNIYDVWKDGDWKLTGNTAEVPCIRLKEHSLDFGRTTANILNLIKTAGNALNNSQEGKSIDPYMIMYATTITGNSYQFPYLKNSGTIRGAIRNSWSEDSGGAGALVGALSEFAKPLGDIISPGWGIEPVKKYDNTAARTIEFSFPLYNTRSWEKANWHYDFITKFSIQNLKTRTSFLTFTPPKIYEVEMDAEGGIAMPAAYASIDVQSIGTLRQIYDRGQAPRLVPEAYKVVITLTELLPQSSNIMQGEIGGKKVQVVGAISAISRLAKPTPQ